MTLLGKTDGASGVDGTGYLDIASFIREHGALPNEDLTELWKRIVFNMAVSNTDDHLRNHGFVLSEKGWRLSPLYDVNPCIYGDFLSLNVSEQDSTIDYGLAVETAEFYGLKKKEAEKIIRKIREIVKENWQSEAQAQGLSRGAVEYMRPAFETI